MRPEPPEEEAKAENQFKKGRGRIMRGREGVT